MKNKIILLISPESWGRNFVSKHHYANYLAKNNTVYFLNPPTTFTKNPFGDVKCKSSVITNNLTVVNYINLLPKLNNLPKAIQKSTYKKQAKQIQNAIGVAEFDLVWSFDPNRFFDQTIWQAKTTIYHTVDFHPNSKYEKEIILSSDLFLGVTNRILEEHTSYRKGIEITHAADLDGFEYTENITLPGANKIRAIYTGNFHKHINYQLLDDLAKENPAVDFIMIGPTADSNLSSKNTIEIRLLEKLKAKNNIHFIGSIPSTQLMSYINKCAINLVLFKKENELIHCSPHKLMGYFYSGNVTLSNFIEAHKNTSTEIITMCRTAEETLHQFEEIKSNLSEWNSAELTSKRKEFAIANSYLSKINTIENLLKKLND